MRAVFVIVALCAVCAAAGAKSPDTATSSTADRVAEGDSGPFWRLYGAPLTVHFGSAEHSTVVAVGIERHEPGGFVWGASGFRNSFGQPCAYAYAGRRFDAVSDVPELFVQLTAGVLYGYREPYESKVPFNVNGISPGAVASVGWKLGPRFSAQVNVLGISAVMLQLSLDLR